MPTWQSLLSNGTVNNPAKPPNNMKIGRAHV